MNFSCVKTMEKEKKNMYVKAREDNEHTEKASLFTNYYDLLYFVNRSLQIDCHFGAVMNSSCLPAHLDLHCGIIQT